MIIIDKWLLMLKGWSTMARAWTRDEVLIAVNLYCQLPFGKLHKGNALIIRVATLLGRTPGSVAMKLSNLASLDPEITASGRVGLPGASTLDRAVWEEFTSKPNEIAVESQESMDKLVSTGDVSELSSSSELPDIPRSTEESTSGAATVTVRKGQAFFRKAVLASYDETCCMSGLRIRRLLVVSHIKPWSRDAANRLNPRNGLCLSALHDKAFDLGFISVRPDLSIAVSQDVRDDKSDLSADALATLEGKKIRMPEKFRPVPDFLDWHYSTHFRR